MLRHLLATTALAFAAFAAPAVAQTWDPIYIYPGDSLYTHNAVNATEGKVVRYQLATPYGITQLRFELAGGTGNANMKVYRNTPTGTPVCDLRGGTNNEVCTQAWVMHDTPMATTWYVEIQAATVVAGATLTSSYLPRFSPVSDLPDMPFAIARRGAFQNPEKHSTTCMQPHFKDTDVVLPEVACMPVGNQQAWHFEMGFDQEYRIKNAWTGRCLAEEGTWIIDRPCNQLDQKQLWKVQGAGGAHHFVALQNVATGNCADFSQQARSAHGTACRFGEETMPAWSLRDIGQRISGAMADDGGTFQMIQGSQCIGRNATTALLADCADRAKTRHMVYPEFFKGDDIDWWTDKFRMVADTNPDQCLTGETATNAVVFRECNKGDLLQQWTPELWGTKSHEWQLRNAQTSQCVQSLGKGSAAGTLLVMGPCDLDERTARFHYVGT